MTPPLSAGVTAGVDGYVEVLDRSRNVVDRLRVEAMPVTVGRAYDNDLVLADPFVCPHHLRIDADAAGQVYAEDLNSLNGLFGQGRKTRSQRLALGGGEPIRIGHTRLRYRALRHPVDATLADHHTRKLLGLFEQPAAQLLIFAAALLSVWLSGFLDSVQRREASEPVFEVALPVAIIVVWAGLWGFAGRVIIHQIKFLAHCAVASTALTMVLVADGVLDYVAFSLSLDSLRVAFGVLVSFAIAGVMLYSHLRFATLSAPWRLASVSSAICIAAAALLFLKIHIDDTEFNTAPQYHATLKAPQFQLVPGRSSTDFFASLDSLRDDVVAQIDTDQ